MFLAPMRLEKTSPLCVGSLEQYLIGQRHKDLPWALSGYPLSPKAPRAGAPRIRERLLFPTSKNLSIEAATQTRIPRPQPRGGLATARPTRQTRPPKKSEASPRAHQHSRFIMASAMEFAELAIFAIVLVFLEPH